MDHQEKLSSKSDLQPEESNSRSESPVVALPSEEGNACEEQNLQRHDSCAPRMILMRGTDGQAVPPPATHSPAPNSRGSHDHVSDMPSVETDWKKVESVVRTANPSLQPGVLNAALVDAAVRAALAVAGEGFEREDSENLIADSSRAVKDDEEMSVDNSESRESGDNGISSPSSLNGFLDDDASKKKPARRKRGAPQLKPGQTAGRWTHEEHQAFLRGLKIYGREWKKVAEAIPTRTSAQIRSHAQKYFAKMSRDESILQVPPLQQEQQPPEQAAAGSASIMALPQDDQSCDLQSLSPSVQATAERILANPAAAQQEVADTIRALRERYRQLQICLEEQQQPRANHPPPRRVSGRIVEEDEDDDGFEERMDFPFKPLSPSSRKRRTLEDCEISSVASSVSASLASRELGDEELIALHVLGGSLPRAASATDLTSNSNGSHRDDRQRNNNSPPSESSSAGSKRSREE